MGNATGKADPPAIEEELRRFCNDVDRLIEECMVDGLQDQKLEELRRARSAVGQVLALVRAR